MTTKLKVPVDDTDHIQGKSNAPLTLVEYGDYQCPYCALAVPIVKKIQKHFGNKLRFVFRNFPLTEMHPYAEVAAESAEFASTHGRFWEMHDFIYAHQNQLSLPLLFELIERVGLSTEELEEALKNGSYKEKIKNDFLGGVYSGVNGTPTFFINGLRHDQSFDYDNLVAAIESHLVEG